MFSFNNLKTLTFLGGYIFVHLYSVQFQQFKYTNVFVCVIAVYNFVLLYFCIVSNFNNLKTDLFCHFGVIFFCFCIASNFNSFKTLIDILSLLGYILLMYAI